MDEIEKCKDEIEKYKAEIEKYKDEVENKERLKIQSGKIDVLINALKTTSEKYVYYLLAVDAACVGFSVNISKDLPLTYYVIPLGISIVLWGISFYWGMQQIEFVEKHTALNIKELKLPFYKDVQLTVEEHLDLYKYVPNNIQKSRKYQNIFFALGVAFFLIWHVLRMYYNC